MSKPARKRSLAENEAKAVTRSIRISPRKLNEVAATIRGMKVDKALAELTFSRRRIAKDVKKTLEVGDRQCREQPRPRHQQAGGRRSLGRQEPGDEALDAERPRTGGPHREILQRADDYRA